MNELKLLRVRSEASENMFKQSSNFLTIISFFITIVTMVVNRLFNDNKFEEMRSMIIIALLVIGLLILLFGLAHYNILQRKLIIDELIQTQESGKLHSKDNS